ncbi:MAG: cellulose synthase complex periplasmic endoglucanase BcsZ [Limnobacter sp.]|nr:cellulose synthase complex periplasmic endoglucanase BcsZ [Limnobacter sp.]
MHVFRKLLILLSLLAGLGAFATSAQSGMFDWIGKKLEQGMGLVNSSSSWPEWEGYKQAFVSEDGRVVDHSTADLRTVSEGQAYALFLALVANDRSTFDKLLAWTENNLSKGDLKRNLPAWHWGKTGDQWGVIDSNSASDADLWILYCLIEASRLWNDNQYELVAQQLAQQVLLREVLFVEGVGLSLLPGEAGFVRGNGAVKLNPSYVPPFLMARLADHFKNQPAWAELYLGSQNLLLKSVENGLFPDWIEFNQGISNRRKTAGDYDAIRVYLWIGMTHPSDPLSAPLMQLIKPFINGAMTLGYIPETWNLASGEMQAAGGPAGFQHALAPAFRAFGLPAPLARVLPGNNETENWREYGYYSGMLSLFSTGFMQGRYHFSENGRLVLSKADWGAQQ